jgi:hypothetical protein
MSAKLLSEIAAGFDADEGVTVGNWFGKPCLKVGGKVFAALEGGDMAFKLGREAHAAALQVEGARPFDPRGQGHPMKQWVQIPTAQSSAWSHFARLACAYVAGAAQAEKDAIIAGLVEARNQILDAARLLSPAQRDEILTGIWSVKDLLAHLAGWDYTNLQAVGEILAGQKPSFWQYHDPNWKSYNARLVAQYKREDWEELLALVQESHRKLIDFLQTVPADEYLKRKQIGSLLRTEAQDERKHHDQVQALRRRHVTST